jgi:hypothetical protein|tara:strand:+ start:25 stop:654 length:630 start_codon:yes stop_codon:yes gene_type:complete
MSDDRAKILEENLSRLEEIEQDLISYDPKAVVLFGSMALYLQGLPIYRNPNVYVPSSELANYGDPDSNRVPKDIDVMYIGDSCPEKVLQKKYSCGLDLLVFSESTLNKLAKSLRHDLKFVSLAKLGIKDLFRRGIKSKKHRIAACLLLGPDYQEFGIENRKMLIPPNEGGPHPLIFPPDKRDHSSHVVLHGEEYWSQIQEYAQDRNSPL